MRETTSKFANDFVVWSPIKIEKIVDDNITLSSRGMFTLEEVVLIKERLLNIEGVSKVETRSGACT